MFAAAGIVVTEIRTPISAPDLAEVRDSIPATPARNATKNEKKSGSVMNSVNSRSSRSKPVGRQAELLDRERDEEPRRDRHRKADRERFQRTQRETAALLHERDAQPRERAELRAHDHRADNQDRRVQKDAGGRDQHGEHHELDEVARTARRSRTCSPRPAPRRPHRTARPARTSRRGRRRPRCALSMYSIAIDPRLGISSSRRSPSITLASSRATSQRITSPSGLFAAPFRKITLQTDP